MDNYILIDQWLDYWNLSLLVQKNEGGERLLSVSQGSVVSIILLYFIK